MTTTHPASDALSRLYGPFTFDETSDMPPDYRAAVVRLIKETGEIGSTESHRRMMRRIAVWPDLAPSLASRVRMAEFYADEMRHGYIFDSLLRAVGEEPDEAATTSIEGLQLVAEIAEWAQVVIHNTLFDRAASFQFKEYVDSSYSPLAHIAQSMALDEQGHATTGLINLHELLDLEGGRQAAQHHLDQWWPIVLDMFGTSTGRRQFEYIEFGLKIHTNEELRGIYLVHARPLLEGLGLTPPPDLDGRRFL